MKKIAISIYVFVVDFFETIVSLLSVILFSSPMTAIKFKNYKLNLLQKEECIVLGNGPSLKNMLDSNLLVTEKRDFFAVNLFCKSEYFDLLKPKYYFLADTVIFDPLTENHMSLVNGLVFALNQVSWEMILFIPNSKRKSQTLKKITNKNIKTVPVNTTPVSGSKFVSHYFYKRDLGMPRVQTVVNFAIFSAINLGYSKIYLFGLDHSWTKDLFVNDQNEVCYGDRHVYNTELTVIKLEKPIHDLLLSFSNMFKSHIQLREYADKVNCTLYNCTQGSFIDAYDRLKLY